MVNNHPFVVMSIEDHKTIDFSGNVRENYFERAKQLHANTISVTFRWNFFEKEIGVYDTTILRNIKQAAEKYDLKVIILWFGSNISGHENSVPDYIHKDSIMYIPYTRSDKTFTAKIKDNRGGKIYCYSFDDKHQNLLLSRETKALKNLITWIKKNDMEETYIMLQIGNEIFVHPELWRPWPPVYLPQAQLLPEKYIHIWDNKFDVQTCSLKIEVTCKIPQDCRLEFILIDTTGRQYWNGYVETTGKQELHIGGKFINQRCQLMIRKKKSNAGTIEVYKIMIKPIAERCHCQRCDEIVTTWEFHSDQHFQQSVFMNYIKVLASAMAEVDQDFPLFLNVLVSRDAKTLLGNPYYRPQNYLDLIPDRDFIVPDIYFESKVAVIDTFNFGRNIIFIPEAGHLKSREDQYYLNAFSLIFLIIGK